MIIYQILPRLYGKGKFSDIDESFFRHVKSLGVSHVWYTGIPRHSMGKPYVKGDTGSPYSIVDYYDVNTYFANDARRRMTEFKDLITRTHNAGLKAIIDFVPNHVSPDYHDAYGGIPHHDWCDYDWTDTAKIDYGHPDTWGKLRDIIRFWCLKGVDGFRCDMVELVPSEFFKWLIDSIKQEFPKVVFIAEVYQKNLYWKYVHEVGFDLLYDKSGLYDSMHSIICSGNTTRCITWNWQSLGDMQAEMLNFLENHDEQRFASREFAGDASKAMAPLAVGAMLTRASFMVYFGQEIGVSARESSNCRTSIFDMKPIEDLQLLHDFIVSGRGLDRQQRSILSRYRAALTFASKKIVADGAMWDLCYCNDMQDGFDPDRHFAFLRYRADADEAAVIVCNFSDSAASMMVRLPVELPMARLRGMAVHADVAPWDYAIVKL